MIIVQSPSASSAKPVFETRLSIGARRQGKVRDIYSIPADPGSGKPGAVLIVATDRISAFDVVLPTPIPGKGKLLTDISARWFELVRGRGCLAETSGFIADHLLSTDPADVPGLSRAEREQIDGRMMLGRAAKVIPVEFVVRGYLAGSGWVDYQQTGAVCGIKLAPGMKQCQRLPEPVFTPATKADIGHDENISFEQACEIAGRALMVRLRDVSIQIYLAAVEHAEARGIMLADTKFEFGYALDDRGHPTDEVMLIDEILTPDSSRFWPADQYEPGRDQESFDKQYVRNYLLTLVKAGEWDKTPPGPELPEEIVRNTLARYREARDRLFGD